MKVYLDSGVFIDYLISRGNTATYLRTTDRRGRAPARLLADAEACLFAIRARHVGITSALTCYEVEEALYGPLRRSTAGLPNAHRINVPVARSLVVEALVASEQFKITLVDLTRAVVTGQCRNLELQERGIRAADSLHVTTALIEGANLLITTDDDLIRVNNVFQNADGGRLRCADTDEALLFLT